MRLALRNGVGMGLVCTMCMVGVGASLGIYASPAVKAEQAATGNTTPEKSTPDQVEADLENEQPADDTAEQQLPSIQQRLLTDGNTEVPDFRKHVVPMLGRLGCNGRACHGSFKGQGGFRLSLFGYDFSMDHKSLTDGEEPRTNVSNATESLMLQKPTMVIPHEGGERLTANGWEYQLLRRWIEGGANGLQKDQPELVELIVLPKEIVFNEVGQTTALKVSAVWTDGTTEDVTPLARFRTNSDEIALIDEEGVVTSHGRGDTHVVAFFDNGVVPVPVLLPVSESNGADYPQVAASTEVDRHVITKLNKLGIIPSETCSDAEFLRRASLDMTGTLPLPTEVEAFIADRSSDKRVRKVNELLERPTYAAWWTTRLCDMTGNNEQALNQASPNRNGATQEWYDWIHKRVAENRPYDEIVAGIVLATGREKDQDFATYSAEMSAMSRGDADFADRETMPYFWARRNVRQPAEKALSFSYSFLGVRIQCAECHKHPFDQWTQDDYKQFTNFFQRVQFGVAPTSRKENQQMIADLKLDSLKGGELRRGLAQALREGETVPFPEVFVIGPGPQPNKNARQKNKKQNKKRNRNQRRPPFAKVLGGENVKVADLDDPRSALMEWMRETDNPYFSRAIVNRVWANYFNVGIVEPPDDLSLANPPSNAALLDYLAQEFIEHDFDLKWLHREIVNSDTYQRSWHPNETNRLDEHNFSRAIPRRLPAEVAFDAVVQATTSNSAMEKMTTDFDKRAIALAGVKGNRNRDVSSYALTIFGKSIRESNCDCDRSVDPNLLQTIYLRNDNETLALIDRKSDGWLAEIAGTAGPSGNDNNKTKQNNNKTKQKNKKQQVSNNKNKENIASTDASEKSKLGSADAPILAINDDVEVMTPDESDVKQTTARKQRQKNRAGPNRKNGKNKKARMEKRKADAAADSPPKKGKAKNAKPDDATKPNRPAAKKPNPIQQTRLQVNRLKVQVAQLEKNGNTEKAAEFKERLAKAEERLRKLAAARKNQMMQKGGEGIANSGSDLPAVQIAEAELPKLIEQAYLRTLSRYPEESEMERSKTFITESPNSIDGMRGLLWALVNTKEFIVNH